METMNIHIKLTDLTKKRLEAMATTDQRSAGGMVRWLIEKEWKRRVENNPTLAEVDEAGGQWLGEA